MTHFRSSALGLFLAVLLCFQATHAQQTTSSENDRAAAEAALREKAYQLLDSLSDQLSSLQSTENRARIGSNIADSIWPHDEKRARDLFRLVTDEIKLGLQQGKEAQDRERTIPVFLKLREDNVERIAKHDPELALAFLKETFPVVAEVFQDSEGKVPIEHSEHALELRLATRIGSKNADVAVQLARQSLEHGLSGEIFPLLLRLSAKNREQAQLLYKDIVRKIGDDDFNDYYGVVSLSVQMVQRFSPPAADETTYRELINILIAKAIARGCDRPAAENYEEREGMCAYLGPIVPLMEKYSPQARRLRHWASDREYAPDANTQAYAELMEVSENGSIDDLLALTSKYPTLGNEILMRAISLAEEDGDLQRAQKLASSYTGSDPNVQHALQERVEFYNASDARLEQQWAEMRKGLSQMAPRERAQALLSAASYITPISKKFALKVLDEANGLTELLRPGEDQLGFQIGLALVYSGAKDDRGFAIMESLMPKLNDLISAAVKLDGYETKYLHDGEWNMSAAGTLGKLLTMLANNAGYFAWCDFDRAVSLAAQFERSEIRMMAQLKLAQSILSGPPKSFARHGGY